MIRASDQALIDGAHAAIADALGAARPADPRAIRCTRYRAEPHTLPAGCVGQRHYLEWALLVAPDAPPDLPQRLAEALGAMPLPGGAVIESHALWHETEPAREGREAAFRGGFFVLTIGD